VNEQTVRESLADVRAIERLLRDSKGIRALYRSTMFRWRRLCANMVVDIMMAHTGSYNGGESFHGSDRESTHARVRAAWKYVERHLTRTWAPGGTSWQEIDAAPGTPDWGPETESLVCSLFHWRADMAYILLANKLGPHGEGDKEIADLVAAFDGEMAARSWMGDYVGNLVENQRFIIGRLTPITLRWLD